MVNYDILVVDVFGNFALISRYNLNDLTNHYIITFVHRLGCRHSIKQIFLDHFIDSGYQLILNTQILDQNRKRENGNQEEWKRTKKNWTQKTTYASKNSSPKIICDLLFFTETPCCLQPAMSSSRTS